jgi:hypothetical protein
MTWRGTSDSYFLLYLYFYIAYLLHVFVTQITNQKFRLYFVDCPFGTAVPFVKRSPEAQHGAKPQQWKRENI